MSLRPLLWLSVPLTLALACAPPSAVDGADGGAAPDGSVGDDGGGGGDAARRPPTGDPIARFFASHLSHADSGGAASEVVAILRDTAGVERDEVVPVSLPFARGQVSDLSTLALVDAANGESFDTSWQPIRHWRDGTVHTAIAHARISLGRSETRRLALATDATSTDAAFQPHPCVGDPANALLEVEVRDRPGATYAFDASAPDAHDRVEVVREDPFGQTVRIDGWLRTSDSLGVTYDDGTPRDFLHVIAYVRTPSALAPPVVTVELALANDYLGWGNPTEGYGDDELGPPPSDDPTFFPLGPVLVADARVHLRGGSSTVAFLEDANGLERIEGEGETTFVLGRDFLLADHQRLGTRYRVGYACETEGTPSETALAASVEHALLGIATPTAHADAGALGLVGTLDVGAIPNDAAARASDELDGWPSLDADPFSSFGESKTPNGGGGSPLMGAISEPYLRMILTGDPRYADKLRQAALNRLKWPEWLHGLGAHRADVDLFWQQGIHFASRNQLGRPRESQWRTAVLHPELAPADLPEGYPHDYPGNDSQHWTINALVDHFAVTGERWAWDAVRDEAILLTRALPNEGYASAPSGQNRNERETGWTFYAMAQAIAIGVDVDADRPLTTWLEDRTRLLVEASDNPLEAGATPPVFTAHTPDARSGYDLVGARDYRMSITWMVGIAILGGVAAYEHAGIDEALEGLVAPALRSLADGYERDFTDPVTGAHFTHGLRYMTMTHLDEGSGLVRIHPRQADALRSEGAGLSLGSTRRFSFTGVTAAVALLPEGSYERSIAQCVGSALYDSGTGTRERSAWERYDLLGAGFDYDTSGCAAMIAARDAAYSSAP